MKKFRSMLGAALVGTLLCCAITSAEAAAAAAGTSAIHSATAVLDSERARLALPNVMYWAGMLGLALGGSALLAYRLRVPRRKLLAAAALIGAALFVTSVGDAVATLPMLSEAVVMQASPASASPVVGAEPQFTVPAAEVVHIRDRHQGFVLVQDSHDRKGWILRENVTPVIPARSGAVAS
jgi:hypothetical protein